MKEAARKDAVAIRHHLGWAESRIIGITPTPASDAALKACKEAGKIITECIERMDPEDETIQVSEEDYENIEARLTTAITSIRRHQMTIGTKYAYDSITTAVERFALIG